MISNLNRRLSRLVLNYSSKTRIANSSYFYSSLPLPLGISGTTTTTTTLFQQNKPISTATLSNNNLRVELEQFGQQQQRRFYAKQHGSGGKHTVAKKSSQKLLRAEIGDEDYSSQLLDLDAFQADLKQELDRYKQDVSDQLSLRTNLNAFENLRIKLPPASLDQTGNSGTGGNSSHPGKSQIVPLNHIAKVTLKNPQMVVIDVSSSPDKAKLVADALSRSALNVHPQADGAMVFVPLPKVTREHRETLSKNAKILYNKYQERLRRVRKHYQDQWSKKEGSVSKDDMIKTTKLVDEIVKDYTKQGENIMKHKQNELTEETNIL